MRHSLPLLTLSAFPLSRFVNAEKRVVGRGAREHGGRLLLLLLLLLQGVQLAQHEGPAGLAARHGRRVHVGDVGSRPRPSQIRLHLPGRLVPLHRVREGSDCQELQEQVQLSEARLPVPRGDPAQGVPLRRLSEGVLQAGQDEAAPQAGARLHHPQAGRAAAAPLGLPGQPVHQHRRPGQHGGQDREPQGEWEQHFQAAEEPQGRGGQQLIKAFPVFTLIHAPLKDPVKLEKKFLAKHKNMVSVIRKAEDIFRGNESNIL